MVKTFKLKPGEHHQVFKSPLSDTFFFIDWVSIAEGIDILNKRKEAIAKAKPLEGTDHRRKLKRKIQSIHNTSEKLNRDIHSLFEIINNYSGAYERVKNGREQLKRELDYINAMIADNFGFGTYLSSKQEVVSLMLSSFAISFPTDLDAQNFIDNMEADSLFEYDRIGSKHQASIRNQQETIFLFDSVVTQNPVWKTTTGKVLDLSNKILAEGKEAQMMLKKRAYKEIRSMMYI